MGSTILLVSDSLEAARVWGYALRQRGHRPELAVRQEDALRLASERSPDLAVVDIHTQESRWLDFCGELRRRGVSPIIFLVPAADESYILAAYACGVDEVAAKPLSPLILLAKVESWLRTVWSAPAGSLEPLTAGNMALDPERRALCIDGCQSFRLTNLELRLLQSLMANPGQVLSADFLIERLWGSKGADAAMLKNVVYRLRRKIEPAHTRQHYIVTVTGQGYRLRAG
jgi:DNA-binding response OmpR family regulator